MESSSFSRSSKRAKALGNIGQVANCLVDGCSADLSLCRDYHRRHKVCEAHSKTPKVTIAGREQRFCQQCSRFHSLVEFDEGKRSCRKRLDGHNRRRRKAQPGSLPQQLVSFSSTPNPMMGYSWSGAVKPPEMKYMESAANSFPRVAIQEASIGQPPFVDGSSSSSSSSSCCFSQVLDSNGAAFSLLSSPTLNNTNTLMDYHLPHQNKPTFHFPDQTLSFMWD